MRPRCRPDEASPGSQYTYTIIGTLAGGRSACGQAVATTLPAREDPAYTRPLVPLARTLTVVTANVANAFALGSITWETKMDRLAGEIAASGEVPDIISMTESSGWTSCTTPASDNSGDYDMVDRLIWRLRDGIGVTYRVAYMVGAEGSFGLGALPLLLGGHRSLQPEPHHECHAERCGGKGPGPAQPQPSGFSGAQEPPDLQSWRPNEHSGP